jgi:hypothetical protein
VGEREADRCITACAATCVPHPSHECRFVSCVTAERVAGPVLLLCDVHRVSNLGQVGGRLAFFNQSINHSRTQPVPHALLFPSLLCLDRTYSWSLFLFGWVVYALKVGVPSFAKPRAGARACPRPVLHTVPCVHMTYSPFSGVGRAGDGGVSGVEVPTQRRQRVLCGRGRSGGPLPSPQY